MGIKVTVTKRITTSFFAGIFALLIGACTTVHVHSPTGEIQTLRRIGIFSVEFGETENRLVISSLRSLGITRTIHGLAIGYHSASVAWVPDSCHLVVWADSSTDITSIQDFAVENDDICTVN